MMSALDPMGTPVATQVVSGERADDKLYIPAIKQVSISLEKHGLLYVGDCKMGALGIRAFIQNSEDYYLCPLSEVQLRVLCIFAQKCATVSTLEPLPSH
jgi:transposase